MIFCDNKIEVNFKAKTIYKDTLYWRILWNQKKIHYIL